MLSRCLETVNLASWHKFLFYKNFKFLCCFVFFNSTNYWDLCFYNVGLITVFFSSPKIKTLPFVDFCNHKWPSKTVSWYWTLTVTTNFDNTIAFLHKCNAFQLFSLQLDFKTMSANFRNSFWGSREFAFLSCFYRTLFTSRQHSISSQPLALFLKIPRKV